MIKVEFHREEPTGIPLTYVVIAARHNGEWLFVRHKERSTYEIPGGHIESGEDYISAAKRELYEETGAKEFTLDFVSIYTVASDEKTSGGYLFFADVKELSALPDYEMAEIVLMDKLPMNLTYPKIQPFLYDKVQMWLNLQSAKDEIWDICDSNTLTNAHKNADRFTGYAKLYNQTRPACPEYVVTILTRYLSQRPQTVVDIGCGTGLSTLIWQQSADRIIGIEPSEDMMAQAIENSREYQNIEFARAFSDNTGLDDGIADIVTCSQSFHWMEPESTLREIARLLKPSGVFAAYDCDWPPICGVASVESAYDTLVAKEDTVESANPEYRNAFIQYPKGEHLANIRKSGLFSYAQEIVFANTEECDADRYYNIALSQGGIQAILKKDPSQIENELTAFRTAVYTFFGERVRPIDFCYRLRLGVKS